MDLGQLITDTTAMREGVWIDGFMGDARIKVAKFDNPDYRAYIQGHRIQEDATDGDQPSDALIDLMCKAMAETVLLDWENFTIRGEAVPYSKEAAYRLLSTFVPFRNQVIMYASQQKNFADQEFEEALDKIGPF